MANTYSTAPFVSHDGKDENGVQAEVKVVTGFGLVDSIEASEKGKSYNVSFSVENTRFKPSGWSAEGTDVLEMVKKAKESGDPIYFRLETRRKAEIDRSIPINDLTVDMNIARESIFKSLAAVSAEEDGELVMSPHAVTLPSQDPSRGGSGIYRATEDDGAPSTNVNSGDNGSNGTGSFVASAGNSTDPGSVAVSVPLELLSFVNQWDRDHDGDVQAQVGEKRRVTVANAMLSVANKIQVEISENLESPDLGSASHTRARALIVETVFEYLPLGAEMIQDKKSLDEWKENVAKKSLSMWRWSIGEVEKLV